MEQARIAEVADARAMHASVHMDAIDLSEVPRNRYPGRRRPEPSARRSSSLQMIYESGRLGSIETVEINPNLRQS